MTYEIENYVVLESSVGSLRSLWNGDIYEATVSGAKIYPIASSLPIIKKGEGCIGLAVIKEVRMTEYSTNVFFEVIKCKPSTSEVLYNIYRDNLSMNTNSSDSYEDSEDLIIPGLGHRASRAPKPSPNKPRRNGWDD